MRSVATVNAFYVWAVAQGYVAFQPHPSARGEVPAWKGRSNAVQTPAEAARDGRRPDTRWFPPRPIGIGAMLSQGLLAERNSGQLIQGRNRCAERGLLRLDDPNRPETGGAVKPHPCLICPIRDPSSAMRPLRLPSSIAKGGSGRRIYIPSSVLRDVWDYVRFERADAVSRAARGNFYVGVEDPLVVEDRKHPVVSSSGGRSRVSVELLNPEERRWLFIARRWA